MIQNSLCVYESLSLFFDRRPESESQKEGLYFSCARAFAASLHEWRVT